MRTVGLILITANKNFQNTDNIHVRKLILKEIQNILHALGYHIHPHGISSEARKPNIPIPPCNSTLWALQPGKPAGPFEQDVVYLLDPKEKSLLKVY
jgi:hypothetical protein